MWLLIIVLYYGNTRYCFLCFTAHHALRKHVFVVPWTHFIGHTIVQI